MIRAYGGYGAAIATLITCAVHTIVLAIYCCRELRLQVLTFSSAMMITAAACMAEVVRNSRMSLPVLIAVYLLAYGAFVWSMAFSAEERRLAVRSVRQVMGLNVPDDTIG